jgi:hypothetical protein
MGEMTAKWRQAKAGVSKISAAAASAEEEEKYRRNQ